MPIGGRAAGPHGEGRFTSLDSLRGVAAVGVVMHHIGAFGLIAGLAFFRQAWLFVDFFFVLSGFVIAAAYGERLAHGFSPRTFLFLRLGRVYPLHFVMVLAYLFAALATGIYLSDDQHGLAMLLRALFLLDGYGTDPHNYFNAPSWSISVELFAYTAAALLFGAGRKGLAIACALVATALYGQLVQINVPVYGDMLQRGVIGFASGVACFWLFRRQPLALSPVAATCLEGAVLACAGMAMFYGGSSEWPALKCVPAFFAVVFVFAHERGAFSRLLRTAPFVAVGMWSYSIYMVHMFILKIMNSGLQFAVSRAGRVDLLRHSGEIGGLRGIQLSPMAETAVTLVVCVLVIAVASQTYRFIEQPARRWAKRRAAVAGAPGAEQMAAAL